MSDVICVKCQTQVETDHVELLVRCCKMDRGSSTIILSDEVWVCVHDLCELLGITQSDCAVEGNGRIPRDWWISAEYSFMQCLCMRLLCAYIVL